MKTLGKIYRITWRICLAALGLAFIGVSLDEIFVQKQGFDWAVDGALLVIDVLMMLPLFFYVKNVISDWRDDLSDDSYVSLFKSMTAGYAGIIKNEVFSVGHVVKEDFNDQERLISQFRDDYNQFFYEQGNGVKENTPIQNTATQVYWNTLSLQKKRLDKKGISMSMEADRMRYGKDLIAVSGDVIFDGKYEISYISEMIHALRTFFKNGKKIAQFKSKEVARYRILDTKKDGKDMIVCPNCGNVSTREDLIDGCDYCGTMFTVEDLGMRVSDFGLYPDPSVEYKKYKESRSKYGLRVGLITAIPCLLYMIYDTIDEIWLHPGEDSAIFVFGMMIICTVFFMTVIISIVEGLFFTTIFPLLQAKASITYLGQKALEAMANNEKHNHVAEATIREHDKLFSLGGFYSDVQNKLAVLHYAENLHQMEAFGEGSQIMEIFAKLPERYENVVNMDVSTMILNDYAIEGDLQKVDVTADLILLVTNGTSIDKKNEKVRMKLIKDKKCLTQAVSGPEISRCEMCGASVSLLEGKNCRYCGNERHLSKYDWAIEGYEIV